jgi:hypothetical protein
MAFYIDFLGFKVDWKIGVSSFFPPKNELTPVFPEKRPGNAMFLQSHFTRGKGFSGRCTESVQR